MSKYKITGSYSMDQDGATFEGQVHNTRICDFIEEIKPIKRFWNKFDNGDLALSNTFIEYGDWNRMYKAFHEVGLKYISNISPINNFALNSMNIGGGYKQAVPVVRVIAYRDNTYGLHRKRCIIMPMMPFLLSVQQDGTFHYRLEGLLNKHFATMQIQSMVKAAKLIDSEAWHSYTFCHPYQNENHGTY